MRKSVLVPILVAALLGVGAVSIVLFQRWVDGGACSDEGKARHAAVERSVVDDLGYSNVELIDSCEVDSVGGITIEGVVETTTDDVARELEATYDCDGIGAGVRAVGGSMVMTCTIAGTPVDVTLRASRADASSTEILAVVAS